ncbi:ATP-binding cassette domain-containing protein [Burkholderia pyrrocinia]|nr:ATP-binding cassette domain-containing protein [Burkholderia pyrrocinia]EKS9897819.1 ATP-binding cassette domain-containing protein [Burkholderia pyrrocinia]EKS9910378.1 ATP-binding cassette domain-containing protein [Burkholderia pyrrocinia]
MSADDGKLTLLRCLTGVIAAKSGTVARHGARRCSCMRTARRGGDLSGDQQQLAIGRALMSEPQLLILDEPTEGIQSSIIQDVGRTLRQLVDESNMTVLLVKQYYDFARSIADRYWVMSRGEIVAGGEARNMETDGCES